MVRVRNLLAMAIAPPVPTSQPKFKRGDVVHRSFPWSSLLESSDRPCIVLGVKGWERHSKGEYWGWTYTILGGVDQYVTWEEYLELL